MCYLNGESALNVLECTIKSIYSHRPYRQTPLYSALLMFVYSLPRVVVHFWNSVASSWYFFGASQEILLAFFFSQELARSLLPSFFFSPMVIEPNRVYFVSSPMQFTQQIDDSLISIQMFVMLLKTHEELRGLQRDRILLPLVLPLHLHRINIKLYLKIRLLHITYM